MTHPALDLGELQGEASRLANEGQAGQSGFLDNFVKMPQGAGSVTIRLLPQAAPGLFERQKSPFYQMTRLHMLAKRSVHCPKDYIGGKWVGNCPICDYYNWLWKESEKKGPEEAARLQAKARSIKPVERYYYNCIVRTVINEKTNEKEENVGPKILSIGKTLHKMIIRAIVGDEVLGEEPLGDVTDLLKGRDFKIMKTMRGSGSQAYPNYDMSRFLDPSPLGNPDQIKLWLGNVHDLVSLRNIRPVEDLKHDLKVHLGLIPDEQVGFDPSEFEEGGAASSAASVATVVNTAVETKPEVAPAKPTNAVSSGSGNFENMGLDPDFLADIQGGN